MPKKTKKEKLIAQLRRKLESVNYETGTTKTVEVGEKPREKTETIQTASYKLPISSLPFVNNVALLNDDTGFIFKDLRKTLILAGLAIGFELIIYFIWH